jgi:hypothetical protein
MSNWVDMRLDVLAPSSDEINKIEKALQEPCEELLTCAAERGNQRVEDIRDDVRLIVRLTPTRNLGWVDPSLNKARRFESEWKDRNSGLVWSHVYFVSQDFPDSIFLAEYWDTGASYAGKSVIRGGREIRHIYDGKQQAQGREWVLLDIFAPYRSEYDIDADFGIFWDAWLLEVEGSVAKLKERYGTPKAETTCESTLLEWERKFELTAEFIEHEQVAEEDW